MDLSEYLASQSWSVVRDTILPPEPPRVVSSSGLQLGAAARQVLRSSAYSNGLYVHQYEALAAFKDGANICLSTSTASGKSLVFNLCALELLSKKTDGTVLALYPLKALTDEQESKWKTIAEQSGTHMPVGRIDGSVPVKARKEILRKSSVIVATPDVMHAWLLSNLQHGYVRDFFRSLQLVVIDEAHTYSGVFGSNAAYLFRRIHHICSALGAQPRYIAASATIRDPQAHLNLLTGQDFTVIDRALDSSGRNMRRMLLIDPPSSEEMITKVTDLVRFVVNETSHQFITFVDSRKQTELMASVLRRSTENDTADEETLDLKPLERLKVYPFRAGYEAVDRKAVQSKLQQGELRGVVSTSALEMGIDIPSLSLGILIGVPQSATSYYQRIGRVGRKGEGTIMIVNDGSLLSRRIFRRPELLDNLPLADSALYLENQRIQYIHAMCLVRPGGEHERISEAVGTGENFAPCCDFPETFLQVCKQEVAGTVPTELQQMKSEGGDDPHHAFPLRDCEPQFEVQHRASDQRLGTLSFSQVMREAYPGAVYYYQTTPYRVYRVDRRERRVLVRPEKRYTTKPSNKPTLIFPNFGADSVVGSAKYGDLHVMECQMQILESLVGYRERHGPTETSVSYPQDKDGITYRYDRFERNYFTSGVLLLHPVLSQEKVDRGIIAQVIFEAFLMEVPFERQDVQYGSDKLRVPLPNMGGANHFLCVYDQTYGSLRLSGRLMEPSIFRGVLEKAIDIALHELDEPAYAETLTPETLEALDLLWQASRADPVYGAPSAPVKDLPQNAILVIAPGSFGLAEDYHHEKFHVEGVIFTPRGLMYRGHRESQNGRAFDNVIVMEPIDRIVPSPGMTELAHYDLNTGEIVTAGIAENGVSFDE
jgi:DEAD/DEAH box helicase domain-containing protein